MIKRILIWPDPKLSKPSSPVTQEELKNISYMLEDMFETMYAAGGVGLSAIQIGVPLRIIVMDSAKKTEEPDSKVLINPEIVAFGPDKAKVSEGCLSVPGVTETVERFTSATVKYLSEDGEEKVSLFINLQAQIIQHEMEHLEGKIFLDHTNTFKRNLIKKQMMQLKNKSKF